MSCPNGPGCPIVQAVLPAVVLPSPWYGRRRGGTLGRMFEQSRVTENGRTGAGERSSRRRAPHAGGAAAAAARGTLAGLGPSQLLALQRAAGNAAVAGAAAERHEHGPSCGHDVQRSAVHEALSRPGAPLGAAVRADMEARLGADFSDVRVHTDHAAHTAAESVQAHAFTTGSDIVFQGGRYDTGSTAGRTMLAHELTHVVQQRSGPVAGTDTGSGLKVSDPSDRFEREAEATARRAMAGTPVVSAPVSAQAAGTPAGPGAVQRLSSTEAATALKDAAEPSGAMTAMGTAASVGSRFSDSDASTSSSLSGGLGAPGIGAGAAAAGLYADARTMHGARRGMKGTEAGTAAHRNHRRAWNGAAGDAAQDGFNLTGNTVSIAGGALKVAESGAADVAGGVGGAFTLPASLIQGGRYIRKAHHARERAEALAKVLGAGGADDSELRTLMYSRDLAGALVELYQAQREWRGEVEAKSRELANRPEPAGAPVPASMTGFAAEIDTAFAATADPAADLVRAELERVLAQTENVADRIAEATEAKRRCDAELTAAIAAYALKKNARGKHKKATVAAGSIAGALAGVAALVAAFAAGAAIAATPLGWALAGLGAALGLAVAAYKTSKYFGKRWDRARLDDTGTERTTGDRVLATLNVMKPLGPGKRELVAGALWELADEQDRDSAAGERDTPVAGVEIPAGSALSIIAALGLDWKAEKMAADRDGAVARIASKMAS